MLKLSSKEQKPRFVGLYTWYRSKKTSTSRLGRRSPRITVINYAFVSFEVCLAKTNERNSFSMTDRPRPIKRSGFSQMKSLQYIVQRHCTSKRTKIDQLRLVISLIVSLQHDIHTCNWFSFQLPLLTCLCIILLQLIQLSTSSFNLSLHNTPADKFSN